MVPRSGRRCPVIRTVSGSSTTRFVGLDVSQKMMVICVVDNTGLTVVAPGPYGIRTNQRFDPPACSGCHPLSVISS
jgi:hypothetical protein